MKHPRDHFAPRPFPGLSPAVSREDLVRDGFVVPPPKITKDTQPTISVTLWRCTVCGKWSHAKRRPSKHTKTIRYDGEFGEVLDLVACGPFEKWEAWKVEQP